MLKNLNSYFISILFVRTLGLSPRQSFKLVILLLTLSVSAGQAMAYTCDPNLPFSQSSLDSCSDLRPTGTGTITNEGTISATISSSTSGQGAIFNEAAVTVLTNTGTIENIVGDSAIYNVGGTIDSIVNSGVITNNYAVDNANAGIFNDNLIINITNEGLIAGFTTGIHNYNAGSQISGTILNNGIITGESYGINNQAGLINAITNLGTISGTGTNSSGIWNYGSIATITNSGTISGDSYGIDNYGSTTLVTINTITNDIGGVITGSIAGIGNSGAITTLNNAQGNLTYSGNLPNNYNIILGTTASTYGKLAVTSAISWDGVTGKTSFGIYSGSVKSTKYTAVISGVTASLLTSSSLTGTYSSGGKSYDYSLDLESGSTDIWNLLFPTYYSGPSVANTNQSLVNTASVLQGTYTLQNSVIANSFSYDCTVFGANNVCVSAGGRNTAVSAANGLNNTSALLIAAYRPHPNYRIGAYADQNLSVSNPGGTVNLGNNTPLLGLFGAWSQRLNGTGAEVKVSAAYGQKNTTITRSVVGSGEGASEAGSGSSNLISQGAQVTAKYGFGIMDNVIVSPYVGVRYTQNNMGGYTETTSSSVTAPLTYGALNTNATTALAGVGASYRVIPTVTTFASAGVETDTNTANGTYSATNASIGTLTPVNFNANPVKTRPTATVGAYYDIEKNQRLGITGIYRQEAYQAVSTTTVMATYTIGL